MAAQNDKNNQSVKKQKQEEEVEVEVETEEELPWIQEKALDLVEFTGSVTQAIPGPRVGQSKLPWILAVPLAYVGVSFVIAFVKTVKKFNSPKYKRKKLVSSLLCFSFCLDEEQNIRNSILRIFWVLLICVFNWGSVCLSLFSM